MLAIIKRLLVMSGDLRGRVQLSILTSFLDAMAAMLPLGAVFLVLERFAAGGLADAALWRTVLLLLVGATLLRILLKYVTYRLQSTAGFEFVARERVSLGDRLRRVPMGFFYDHSLGDLTATMTNDLNYLENYGMHRRTAWSPVSSRWRRLPSAFLFLTGGWDSSLSLRCF